MNPPHSQKEEGTSLAFRAKADVGQEGTTEEVNTVESSARALLFLARSSSDESGVVVTPAFGTVMTPPEVNRGDLQRRSKRLNPGRDVPCDNVLELTTPKHVSGIRQYEVSCV